MKTMIHLLIIAAILNILISFSVTAGELTIPNTFMSKAPAVADEVNANFSAIETEVNDNNSRINMNESTLESHINDNNTHLTFPDITDFGVISFCGDGSAGDKTISTDEDWTVDVPDNINFNNFTINSGVTLTVAAGTVIKCAGDFNNNGILIINECTGALNNTLGAPTGDNSDPSRIDSQSHPGDAQSSAEAGCYHYNSATDPCKVYGGQGGGPIYPGRLMSFNNLRIGGGSGGGFSIGACGGGLIKVYCRGSIINQGQIIANGTSYADVQAYGVGGGAGGIVILASMTSINNSGGFIYAMGGDGSDSMIDTTNYNFACAPGAGGGGGIVVFAAPVIDPNTGTIDVSGGSGGSIVSTPVPASIYMRWGGGGGGGCGGVGGWGGTIDYDGTIWTGTNPSINGSIGYILPLTINPLSRIF